MPRAVSPRLILLWGPQMTTRHTKKNAGKLPAIDRNLVGSAYNYYGGVVRATQGKEAGASGLRRRFATALLSGASLMAVTFGGAGTAAAGSCNTVNTTVICTGVFDETIQYNEVDDLTVILGAGSSIDTTDDTSEADFDNAGIFVTGDDDVSAVNHGSIVTGDNTHYVEYGEDDGAWVYGGDRHHGIAAYSTDEDAYVLNSATGTIVTTSENSYGMVANAWGNEEWGGDATAINNGIVGTSGDESHGVVAVAKYDATIENTHTVLTSGDGAHGLYGVAKYDVVIDNGGTIETTGEYSHGINASIEEGYWSAGGEIEITNSGSVETAGEDGHGIFASAWEGYVDIENSGTIDTHGEGANGIAAYGDEVYVVNTVDGTIVTEGDEAYGVAMYGDTVSLDNAGIISTYGEDAHAVVARSGGIATTTITNTGLISAYGEEANAIVASGPTVRIYNNFIEAEEGDEYSYDVTGVIDSEDGAAIRVDESGDARVYNAGKIYSNVSIDADEYAYVVNTGTVSSDRKWKAAIGIDIAEGTAVVDNEGTITTTNKAAPGIEIDVELGDAYVTNSGSITTDSLDESYSEGGWSSHGIDVFAEDNAIVLNTGDVTTYGSKAKGILIETEEGTAAGVNSGTIDTWGEKSTGLSVSATSREHYDGYTWYDISGSAIAGNIGSIETRGEDASGATALAEGGLAAGINVLGGSISTSGDDAHGLIAAAGFENIDDAVDGEEGSEEGGIAVALNGLPPQLIAALGDIGDTYIGEGYGLIGEIAEVLVDALPQGEYDPADFRSTIVTTGDNAIGVGAFVSEGTAIAANFYGSITTGTRDESGALTGYYSHGLVAGAEDGLAAAVNKYHGDIVTNGDRAIGILVSAEYGDAFAANKYEASVVTHGDESHGMAVHSSGEDDYDKAAAYNLGSTITTYGEGSIGIVVTSEEGDAFAVNDASSGSGIIPSMDEEEEEEEEPVDGRIETWGEDAHGIGVTAWQGEAEIYNGGTIVTHGDYAFGAVLEGDTVELRNYGTISTYGYVAHGVVASSDTPTTTTVYNDGTISVTGEGSDAIHASGPSIYITNTEDGIVSSEDGDAIYAFETKYVSILNHGDITGDILVSANNFLEYDASSYILNTGTVTGDIDTSLDDSDDTIVIDGGTVTGAVYTGDGTDHVTVSGTGVELGKGIHATESGFSILEMPEEDYATLTFEHDDTITLDDGIYGWAISHFDKVDIDSGTLVLDGYGIHTTYAEGEIAVAEGATLGVTSEGAYADAGTVDIDGTLSLALGGWFDVSGDVSFNEGSTFRTQLSSDGAAVVYGDTVFFSEGSSIFVDVKSGLSGVVGEDMLIASASEEGGVTDEGASVSDNTILFDFKKVMDDEIVTSGSADELFLRVEIAQTAEDAELDEEGRVNLVKVAQAIDKYISTQPIDSPLVEWLTQFETEEEQYDALLKLVQDTMPDESDGAGNTTMTSTDLIFDMIMDRLSGGGFSIAMKDGETGLAAGDAQLGGDGKWALWGRIGASKAEYTPSGVNGFDADTWGGTVGIDGEVAANTRIGVGAFYSSSDVDENGTGANSSVTVDGYGLVAYLSHRPGAWYVNGSLGFGMNDYDSARNSLGGVNVATYDGTQFVARVEVGRMFTNGAWDLTPNVGLRYNLVDIDGYTETGPLPTTIDDRTITSVRAVGGVNARYTMALDGGARLIPEVGVKLLGELADPDEAISGNVVGGGSFVTQTTPRDDVSYGFGAGLTYEASDRLSIRVTYDGEFQSDYDEQAIAAAIRWAF